MIPCPKCGGTGQVKIPDSICVGQCPKCHGRRWVVDSTEQQEGSMDAMLYSLYLASVGMLHSKREGSP